MPIKKRTSVKTKKKVAPAARVKRTTRAKRPQTQTLYLVPVTFRRIVYFTACVLLVIAATLTFGSKGNLTQAVAGVSVARGLFVQTTVALPEVDGATAYNIYYKQTSESDFTNAVRNIPANIANYTVSYLKKGASYEYKISALDSHGEEFFWTEVQPIIDLQPM